ncbi:MAG: hypothetical protein IPP34_16620 [Bacteroidetes bacterium]|nr:hypothetical protein [Bacteroidota bacterium]
MKKKFYLIFLFVCSFYSSLIGQSQLSYYGHTIPVNTNIGTNGSLRIMIVFVELVGSCAPNDQPDWHPGSLPTNVNTHYFDANFTNNPSNYISKYFWEASFGQFKVEGDYVADLIQIPCTSIDPVTDVLTALDNRELAGTLGFGTYSSITEFDHYSIAGIGDFALKTNNSNGFIDGMIICFRNSPYTPCSSGGGSGGGCIEYNSQPGTVGAMGIDAGCAFGMCANLNSVQMIIAEFFHAMYGHNNWHLGDGAGPHAFPFKTNPWGIATQSNGAGSSNVVSAWDRDFCGWYGWSDINKTIHKNDLIMAKDNSANDIVTDFELNNFLLQLLILYCGIS